MLPEGEASAAADPRWPSAVSLRQSRLEGSTPPSPHARHTQKAEVHPTSPSTSPNRPSNESRACRETHRSYGKRRPLRWRPSQQETGGSHLNATGLPTTELRSAGIIRSMAQPGRNLPRNAPDWLSLSDACAVSPPPPAGYSSRCSRVCSPHQTPMVAPERARVSSVVESKSVVERPLICRTNDPTATPAMFDSVTTGGSGPRRVIAPSSGTLRAENEPEPCSTKPSFSNSSRSSLELPFDSSGIRYESRVAIDGGGVSPDGTHIHDADIDSESAVTQLSGCDEFFS